MNYRGLVLHARPHTEDIGFYARSVKPETSKWFKPQPGEVVVDCGASVGIFTLIALNNRAIVYSFEPNPSTFSILEENIRRNGFSAILKPVGLSNFIGNAKLFSGTESTATSPFNRQWVREENIVEYGVNVTTLDHELREVPHVNWLLIDGEGGELRLLEGAEKTLEKTQRIIIEISRQNERDVLERLRQDFEVVEVGNRDEATQYFYFERK